ncbi:alpha/beta hydrolase [Aquimarina rhabdastrellae]
MKELMKKYLPLLVGRYLTVLHKLFPEKALKMALYLFCTPQKGKTTEIQNEYLIPLKDLYIDFKDIKLQSYRWEGEKETVLLIHGWESNSHRWKTLAEKLNTIGYNVIAVDAPAHGNSTGKQIDMPLYTDCIEHLISIYKPAIIIGHSMGGMATLYHQYKYNNASVNKIIALAAPAELEGLMQRYQNILGFSSTFMQDLEAHFMAIYGFRFTDFSIPKFIQQLSLKGLIVHDIEDDIIPYQAAIAISQAWKDAILITTQGQGHSLFAPQVDEDIISFIQE